MEPKLKRAKPVIEFDIFIGRKSCCNKERALSTDSMHKDFVRNKRNHNHLPDSWDTKFIRRQKCWKYRVKKKRQWMKHFISITEWNWIRDIWN